MKKRLILLLAIMGLSLTACGGSETTEPTSGQTEVTEDADATEAVSENSEAESSSNEQTTGSTGVFTIAMDQMPTSLKSSFGNDTMTIITRPIYDPLFQEVKEDIEYRIADKLDISDDRLTYTVHIADEANWSDGTPIIAEDILFTIEYADHTGGGMSNYSYVGDKPVEINAIDDKTVEFKLPEQKNTFIYHLSQMNLIPAHAFESVEEVDTSSYFMTPGMATSGAYEVVEINTDSIVYKARDDYHRGAPQVHTVILKLLGSGSTRNVAFENGEISYNRVLSGDELEKYKQEPDKYNIESVNEGRVNYLQINPNGPTMKDLPVEAREAIMSALNQDEILMAAYGSEEIAQPANSILNPQQNLYDPEAPGYTQDLDKAKKVAEETGLAGKTLVYIYNKDRANMEQIAIIVQQQLAQIGVNVQVEGLDNATFFSRFWPADGEQISYDLGTNGWDTMRGVSLVQPTFYLNNQERWGWSDEVVALTDGINSESDPVKEMEMAKELQTRFLDDNLLYPLPFTNFVTVSHSNVDVGQSPVVPEFGDYLIISVD